MLRVLCGAAWLGLVTSAHAQPVRPGAQPAPSKGWFGIGLEAATDAEQAEIGVPRPVPRVVRVFRGSPAETSGVQIGDFVVGFDGQDVRDTKDLIQRVGAKPPGAQVVVELHRPSAAERVKLNVMLDLRVDLRDRFKQEWLGQRMPTLSITGVQSPEGEIALGPDATAGSVVVIDYFATWCGPCRQVMPELEQMQRDLGAYGVKVIGVSSEEPEVVRGFLTNRPLAYPIGVDTTGDFSRQLMVSVLPTIWVIDREGVIQAIHFGSGHHAEVLAAVRVAAGLPATGPLPERKWFRPLGAARTTGQVDGGSAP